MARVARVARVARREAVILITRRVRCNDELQVLRRHDSGSGNILSPIALEGVSNRKTWWESGNS